MSAASQDFFELLGLERRFDLDTAELEARYREQSKVVHPDRHVGKEARERVQALQGAMLLNEAVKTLKKPSSRAEYLLSLYGVTIGDHERIEPDLIMSVLEAREELAEALANRDSARLEDLEEGMLDRKDEILEETRVLFSQLGPEPEAEVLSSIKRQLVLLRYVNRYLEQFDELMDDDDRAAV